MGKLFKINKKTAFLGKNKKAVSYLAMANQFYRGQKFLSRLGLWKSEKIPVMVGNNPELSYEKDNWKINQKGREKRKI